jgi:hypothetical protein
MQGRNQGETKRHQAKAIALSRHGARHGLPRASDRAECGHESGNPLDGAHPRKPTRLPPWRS